MSRIDWLRHRIQLVVPLIMFVVIAVIWFNYYSLGFSYFNKNNAVSIFGSVIQGMSALLSVAIAVIIFRIQSLENRNASLEQFTLDYIHRITDWTYPQTIQRIRNDVFSSVVFLMLPILFSFLLLMVSDALDPSYNFVFVSLVVLMSAVGIALLVKIVLEFTVQN